MTTIKEHLSAIRRVVACTDVESSYGQKEIEDAIRAIEAELDRPMKAFNLTDQDIRLACGELNGDEMRLARAIIKWLEFRFNNRL